MKKLSFYFLGVILLGMLILGSTVGYRFYSQKLMDHPLLSPLPNFLTRFSNDEVSTMNLFLPHIQAVLANSSSIPEFSAQSILAYDLTTQKTLVAKNSHTKLPMASLTKIMTAIVALEHKRADDKYTVHSSDIVGEDSMGLSVGEQLSLEELLYGMVLTSGNDAAETIASNYPLGREAFVKDMNKKVESFGLFDSHFTNPSGLQGDGEQFTTAYDLLVISRYALENFPLFAQIASTFDYTIPQTDTHKAFYLENETNLLSSYPGVKGIKTGYTPEAGLCLVTYLEYHTHRIIGILLNSNNRREEMKELLDYSLKSYGITPPVHS